ncbi:ATP adenylyltransferase [Salana multivorans]|uniref:ATP adenylyltransferase n=1 Tax=Salana multivorans TaxID=120377 RepID=A0A3N2D1I0_9MICO|nr:HIT domain-containing protein [Salana multivorans]ROR93626.1 ATP adenylyltransferase [Salana multivorans]
MSVSDQPTAAGTTPGEDATVESAADLAGDPDPFQRLWTPHRMVYIDGADKPASTDAGDCPFCRIPSMTDEAGLVVHRGERAYVVLNLYPYNPGHLMVVPYRHVAGYPELDRAELVEVATLTQQAMRVLRGVSSPAGFNLGVNQGAVGGAGIAAHLHQHVVPRWQGDANFMPIVAGTKPLPQLLGQSWRALHDGWDTHANAPQAPEKES